MGRKRDLRYSETNDKMYRTESDRWEDIEKKHNSLKADNENIKSVNKIITGVVDKSVNATFNNTPIIQAFVDNLRPYEKLTLPKGEYYCATTLNMLKLPIGVKIDFQGVLSFKPGVLELDTELGKNVWKNGISGVRINPTSSRDIFFQEISTPIVDYALIIADTSGIELINGSSSNIKINKISGFKRGFKPIGHKNNGGLYNNNGTLYCDVDVDRITACYWDVFITCLEEGYVNENRFHFKWLDGHNGVEFYKDTNGKVFDGNKLEYIGLETIKNDGIILNDCLSNIIYSPRVENVTRYVFSETANCISNQFIVQFAIKSTALDLNGKKRTYIGQIANATGDSISFFHMSSDFSVPIYFAPNQKANMLNNTVYFGDNTSPYADKLCSVKRNDGTIADVKYEDTSSNGALQVINTNATILRTTKIVGVSSGSTAVVLTTDQKCEQKGFSFLVSISTKTNAVSVKKSTGSTSIADFPSVGIFQVINVGDVWKYIKLSDTAIPVLEF